MRLFDFHHHKIKNYGIYNSGYDEIITNQPFSVGLHPKDISKNFNNIFEIIKKRSVLENCFAIGECGLDGIIEIDIKAQESVFQKHISLANDIGKPLIIHCVRRFPEIIRLKKLANTQMVIHGFNKKKNIADELLQKGFYLSFGKAILQNVSLQQTVKNFPVEKLFLETDDADLEIGFLYQKVSELKNLSIENLHSQILENLEKIRQ